MNTKRIIYLIGVSILALMLLNNFAFSATPDEFDDYTGCTTIIVGKDATVDGSTMTTHTADCGLCDSRLIYVPAKDHKSGEMRPVFLFKEEYPRIVSEERSPYYAPIEGQEPSIVGYIPEVEHTYAYFDGVYGIMNEHRLAMGECTCGAKTSAKPKPEGEALFDVAALSRVAMERCTTAREAIKLMGDLGVEYGYYGWGETMTVIDPKEAWVFDIIASPDGKSAIWVAQKVPGDEVAVMSNEFTIREIDLKNSDYFMASDNIFEIAKEKGWWDPATPFDFTAAYSPGEYAHPYYSLRRKWRAYDLLAPSKKFSPWVKDGLTKDYPFSIKPDKKISVKDLFTIQRDHYEGTEFDLTKGMAAGAFGTPNRYGGGKGEKLIKGTWERALSMFRCDYTFVLQERDWLPDPVGGVTWFGPDAPHSVCYVPFYAGITKLPESYYTGTREAFTRNSAWWAFNFVSNWADLKYCYMIKDINLAQERIEGKELAMQPAIDQAAKMLYTTNPDLAREYLTDYCINNGNAVIDEWWKLADYLVTKYIDGYTNIPDVGKGLGYPAEWLKEVGYDKGPLQYEKPEK